MTFTKLSKKQKTVFRWAYKPDAYALICDGSVRSGKTASMACAFILWAMSTFDRARFGICGNTVQSAERNIIMELLQMADITHYFNVSYIGGSKHILTVKGNGKQNQFHVFGGKDEASYKLVQGITLSGVFFDEVALMPESFVNQAIARTLSVGDARLWFNCNPDNPQHWFYQQWILKADNGERNDVLHLHFTMQDNPIMTPQKIQRAASVYPAGAFYDRYVLGLWRVAEGLIYPQFDREKHIEQRNNPQGEWYISVDYGTLNAFSAGLWCYDGTTAYRAAEYYYSGRETRKQLTNAQYLQRIQQLAGSHKIECVIVDPSAASFIAELRNADFTVRKGKNAVVDGIRRVSSALQAGKLQFSPDCKGCIREFGLYRWDESCSEDRPIKENDHAMDDVRYFVNTIMGEEASISRVMGGL
ncbi:MAG: PBSX family phage terminase large subunit [Ruminococcus sp.]|nr:PBSX family phage terminase large subunit [Ruminococcus sp.]